MQSPGFVNHRGDPGNSNTYPRPRAEQISLQPHFPTNQPEGSKLEKAISMKRR